MKCVMLMVYVCVSSPFCSCKDAVRYLNESCPTEADRSIGVNQTSFPCFSELHLLSLCHSSYQIDHFVPKISTWVRSRCLLSMFSYIIKNLLVHACVFILNRVFDMHCVVISLYASLIQQSVSCVLEEEGVVCVYVILLCLCGTVLVILLCVCVCVRVRVCVCVCVCARALKCVSPM